jgi:hypothetical protein
MGLCRKSIHTVDSRQHQLYRPAHMVLSRTFLLGIGSTRGKWLSKRRPFEFLLRLISACSAPQATMQSSIFPVARSKTASRKSSNLIAFGCIRKAYCRHFKFPVWFTGKTTPVRVSLPGLASNAQTESPTFIPRYERRHRNLSAMHALIQA